MRGVGGTSGSGVWEVERGREGGTWASGVEASWRSRGWLGLEVEVAGGAGARHNMVLGLNKFPQLTPIMLVLIRTVLLGLINSL